MHREATFVQNTAERIPDAQNFVPEGRTRFAVVLVSPPGYVHSEGLREVAEVVHYGLLASGYDSILSTRLDEPGRRSILLGAHLLSRFKLERPRPGSILYNLEQIDPESGWIGDGYLALLRGYAVWDYSQHNIARLRQRGVRNLHHVPLGWTPEIGRIAPAAVQDIDVLFYGSVNERRARLLRALQARQVSVKHVFGVYGKERDALIARAKIVLNLHYYESKIFEIVRVSYLLSNGVCVLSEEGSDPMEKEFAGALRFAPYDGLADACLQLLSDEAARKELGARGRALMQSRPEGEFLKMALEAEAVRGVSPEDRPEDDGKDKGTLASPLPGALNIGSGKDWKAEALNLDIQPAWNPDAVYDLNQPLPAGGVELRTERFGTVRLTENHFDIIYAFDVLEHLAGLSAAMSTCLAWLKIGGVLRVNAPYDLSWGAWQDPTHVRAFNERSWLYYTDWYWYLGWDRWRFDLVSLQYMLSPIGKKLHQQGASIEDLTRTPRAVDSMLVDLRKRPLTQAEIAVLKARRERAA